MPDAESQSRAGLAGMIAMASTTDPHLLLPTARSVEGSPAPPSLTLDGAAEIEAGRWIGVFATSSGAHVAAPFCAAASGLVRAVAGDGAAAALIEKLASGSFVGDERFVLTSYVSRDVVQALGGSDERAMLVDQTHESVVVGEVAVVKWAVYAEATPAPVLIAHLEAAEFAQMPRPWGFLTWHDGEDHLLVASVMQYLTGASDGWTWAVSDAGDYAARGARLEESVAAFDAVGVAVAELHLAFATATPVIETPVQVARAAQIQGWHSLAIALFDDAADGVDGVEGERLALLRGSVAAVLDDISRIDQTTTIPVHGDLHIGQVLRWDDGYAIGDFDGNPVLTAQQRLVPQPAARDVAGMVQSIDHVGRVVSRRVEGADADRVTLWIARAQDRFLAAYRARLAERGQAGLLDDRLLLPFQVEQECREFLYAIEHLPRWRYVPDQALQALFPTV